jgi:cystathionine beta-lyase/cystathionine gamma-synthase
MAAVHAAVANFVNAGDEIISHSTIYGCTYSMFSSHLSRFGVKTHFVDLRDPARLAGKINQKTRVVYLESPVNPNLDLLDLEALANQVKAANAARKPDAPKIICIVDNTFATPWCQRPLQFGVDLVVHSLTKGISGFGVDMGGAIITRKEFYQPLCLFRKDFGSFLAPNEAWRILNFGVSTLALRVPRQQDNALKVAKFLESHPKVARVSYPGLDSFPQSDLARKQMRSLDGSFAPGFVLYFVLAGEPEAAKAAGERMMDFVAENAYAITLAVSLGQLRTLIEHPGSMTHVSYAAAEQISLGIDPGGIRISVGIEDPSDIVRDLAAALATV